MSGLSKRLWLAMTVVLGLTSILLAQTSFHNAPASAKKMKNPYAGQASAVKAGQTLFEQKCSTCHGKTGTGTGNVPALDADPTKSATSGEIFWFITQGSVENGMPAWASLPAAQRWQLVSFVKSLSKGTAPKNSAAPAPTPSSVVASNL